MIINRIFVTNNDTLRQRGAKIKLRSNAMQYKDMFKVEHCFSVSAVMYI